MSPPASRKLEIPRSSSIVSVSAIDSTATIRGVDRWKFMSPDIAGHDYLATPCYSFLIEHKGSESDKTRRLIFDLGIRKDWQNLSPFLQRRFGAGGYQIDVKQSVKEILESGGIICDDGSIEAVIWSHWHFDHTGNPAEFPASTKLVVGSGFKEKLLPGYPTNPESAILESDYSGRALEEIDFTMTNLQIGGFPAHDYFGDGSFYLLDTPGHAVGHMCGLARVTVEPPSFVFLGGDIAHHAGEWRPSRHLPLPQQISPHPFHNHTSIAPCPGAMFESLGQPFNSHSSSSGRTESFYRPAKLEQGQIHVDIDQCIQSIRKMQDFDGDSDENILVLVAHDESVLDVINFFPKTVNDFMRDGLVQRVRWRFLRDFVQAVGWSQDVPDKRDWSPLPASQTPRK